MAFMLDITPAGSPDFKVPAGITMAAIDPQSGGLATSNCPRVAVLPFLTGTAPAQICPLHGGQTPPPTLVAGSGSSAPAAPVPSGSGGTPATNGVFGAIGNFFGSLFHH